MNKKAEIKRLHPIVFDGAPNWATHAFKDFDSMWFWLSHYQPYPDNLTGLWSYSVGRIEKCKNQPETDLDWTETLIER